MSSSAHGGCIAYPPFFPGDHLLCNEIYARFFYGDCALHMHLDLYCICARCSRSCRDEPWSVAPFSFQHPSELLSWMILHEWVIEGGEPICSLCAHRLVIQR